MSENKEFETETYETTRPYLKAALEEMIGTGRSVRDWAECLLERFGDAVLPYLKRFLQEAHEGKVKIVGLSQSAKTAIFGAQVTEEQRTQMIREKAYLHAEQRGFVGGSPAEDWAAAQHEVDEALSHQIGLVEKGRQSLASVEDMAHKEMESLKETIASWTGHKPGPQGG